MSLFKRAGICVLLLSVTWVTQAGAADAAVNAAAADAEDPAAELIRLRAQFQKAYEPLNALNPMSTAFNPANGGAQGTTAAQTSSATVQTLRAGWSSIHQAGDRLLSNPGFVQGVEGIAKSPSRMDLLYAQIALIILILALRFWRFGKCETWYARIWVNIWTGALYWIGMLIALPWAVIGQPYFRALAGIAALWAK